MPLPYFEYAFKRLNELAGPDMLCAFDFDGTLAPVAVDPGQVVVPTPVARRLAILADRAAIAVVSGRAAADVRARLNFVAHYVVGNHGQEGVPGCGAKAPHEAVSADVLPGQSGGKGAAIVRMMEDCGARSAIYVGADATDEDIFRLHRKNLLTVRIGPDDDSEADFFLHHRIEMVQLLDNLISRLR